MLIIFLYAILAVFDALIQPIMFSVGFLVELAIVVELGIYVFS